MEIRLDSRGQSSITDALFILLIVSILSTWLFYASAVYGLSVQQQLAAQRKEEYTKSALETIIYTSMARQPNVPLEDADEVDYLLAALKEDYADDAKLDETLPVLSQNITGIMQPLTPNSDYLFFVYLTDKQLFPVVLLHANGKLFSCSPKSKQALSEFLLTTGNPDTSNSRIQMIEGSKNTPLAAQITLVTWIATNVDETSLGCAEYRIA